MMYCVYKYHWRHYGWVTSENGDKTTMLVEGAWVDHIENCIRLAAKLNAETKDATFKVTRYDGRDAKIMRARGPALMLNVSRLIERLDEESDNGSHGEDVRDSMRVLSDLLLDCIQEER